MNEIQQELLENHIDSDYIEVSSTDVATEQSWQLDHRTGQVLQYVQRE
jgi:hypothetical protein